MDIPSFDSLIFDMDGTLWDAVDSYCLIWDEAYRRMGIDRKVSRDELLKYMGMSINEIVARIAPTGLDIKNFYATLGEVDDELMPVLGGRLYPGVKEFLPLLAQRYRLFMVSNCGARGLEYFMDYTGLREYFTDTLSFGQTFLNKENNIETLCRKYNLLKPAYIGDTQGDCNSAHAAGATMIHVTYGFGTCRDAEYNADSFNDLASILL